MLDFASHNNVSDPELAIMLYVLAAIVEPGDTIIVAVLGIIYATIPQHGAVPTLHDHANGLGE